MTLNLNFCEQCKNQTSIYNGVCWHRNNQKWQARLKHNKNLYHGGLFDNEEQAAMKVNLLCDKNGIERKNPVIDIEPDVIREVMHSYEKSKIFYRRKDL